MKFEIGDKVKHFKGGVYVILCSAVHTETNEELVVYQAEYGESKIYARPAIMFESKVDKSKYPNCKQIFRFELIQ